MYYYAENACTSYVVSPPSHTTPYFSVCTMSLNCFVIAFHVNQNVAGLLNNGIGLIISWILMHVVCFMLCNKCVVHQCYGLDVCKALTSMREEKQKVLQTLSQQQ